MNERERDWFDVMLEDADRLHYPVDDHICHIDNDLLCPCDKGCCLFPREWNALEDIYDGYGEDQITPQFRP